MQGRLKIPTYPYTGPLTRPSGLNLYNHLLKRAQHTGVVLFVQLLLLVGIVCPGFSQFKFYSLVSENQVSYNQTFQVQYVIEGAKKIQEFTVPDFKDFQLEEVFELPATPALDPKTLKLVDQHSKIAVLTPIRTGVFMIPGATAIIDGKKIRSNAVKVSVKASPLSRHLPESAGRVIDGSELMPGEDPAEKIRSNFFVRAEISKSICYTGEPLMATYKAYSRVNANSHVAKRPAFTGFSVLEMVDGYEGTPSVEQYNGNWYYVHLVRKVQLFPLQAGNYELDPAEIEGTIHFIRYNNNPQGPNYEPVDHPVVVSTQPVPVSVLPLPDSSQPEIFAGAVGQYSMTVKVANKQAKAGELVQFQIVINGTGNIPLITAPVLKWPEGIDASDPEVKESINKYSYPVSGSKSFTYTLVTSRTGEIVLPPVSFSYFDPISKAYRTLHRDSILLNIQPSGETAKELPREGKDVNGSSFSREAVIFSIIVLIIIGWVVYQVTRFSSRSKPLIAPATVVQAEPFAKAREFAHNNDERSFFNEVLQQLCVIAGQKCKVEPSALNKRTILERFRNAGIPEPEVIEFIGLMEACENFLYGVSVAGNAEKEDILQRAERIAGVIGQKI